MWLQPTGNNRALESLVNRYKCIVGYPDRHYLRNRFLTRFEFAAGVSACGDRIKNLIASSTKDTVLPEDLATLQRLQEEFRSELAVLSDRIDAVETRLPALEAHPFSSTGKD